MVSFLILEDEHYTRQFLEKLIVDNPLIETSNILSTGSSLEAIELVKQNEIDIALIDIELAPDEALNGLETAKIIYQINPSTNFVFVTGYAQYAVDSFTVHPYDYIVKPVNKEKFMESTATLVKKINKSKVRKHIIIKNTNEHIFLKANEIFFIEKSGKGVCFHTIGGVYEMLKNLDELEQELGPSFLRVHKSFIVNFDKIRKIKEMGNRSFEIEFNGYDKRAVISRSKFKKYKHLFTPR